MQARMDLSRGDQKLSGGVLSPCSPQFTAGSSVPDFAVRRLGEMLPSSVHCSQ